MGMGRKRTTRTDLPRRMYHHHGSYYFIAKDGKRTNLGRDFVLAMKGYADLLQSVKHARTIGDVMDEVLLTHVPTKAPKTQEQYQTCMRRLRPVFGQMNPADLEPKHVYMYQDQREAKVRANREIAVLSIVMNLCVRKGLCNTNPIKQVKKVTEKARKRRVTQEEIDAFLPLCPDWLQKYIRLKLLTGLRQEDILNLTRANLREDGLYVKLGKSGGEKELLFQWSQELLSAVEDIKGLRRRVSSIHLFMTSHGTRREMKSFQSAWRAAMLKYKQGGGEWFVEHDLRAVVASTALAEGRDATTMLGHSTDAVTRRHYIRGATKIAPLR